jgi:hypothetical protein
MPHICNFLVTFPHGFPSKKITLLKLSLFGHFPYTIPLQKSLFSPILNNVNFPYHIGGGRTTPDTRGVLENEGGVSPPQVGKDPNSFDARHELRLPPLGKGVLTSQESLDNIDNAIIVSR